MLLTLHLSSRICSTLISLQDHWKMLRAEGPWRSVCRCAAALHHFPQPEPHLLSLEQPQPWLSLLFVVWSVTARPCNLQQAAPCIQLKTTRCRSFWAIFFNAHDAHYGLVFVVFGSSTGIYWLKSPGSLPHQRVSSSLCNVGASIVPEMPCSSGQKFSKELLSRAFSQGPHSTVNQSPCSFLCISLQGMQRNLSAGWATKGWLRCMGGQRRELFFCLNHLLFSCCVGWDVLLDLLLVWCIVVCWMAQGFVYNIEMTGTHEGCFFILAFKKKSK